MPSKLFDFNSLDIYEQATLLWKKGVMIGERKEMNLTVLLYSLEGFHVEVFYNPAINKIEKFSALHNDSALEPYLEKINLSDLGI